MFTERASKKILFALMCGSIMTACTTPALSEPAPLPIATATSEPTQPAQPVIEWNTYTHSEHGFSFEYPALYVETPRDCGPKSQGEGQFQLGYRIFISSQADDAEIETLADEFVATVNLVEKRETTEVDGETALTIDYRFGGTNRFGTVTFTRHNDRHWVFNWTAGVTCDIPESELFELDVYRHMLETFQFSV